jgi:nifR3 family TIM-barrel protein
MKQNINREIVNRSTREYNPFMTTFWHKLKKPFLVLAPMEDVTDHAFRELLSEIAPPDVYFTEFTNADGLCSEGFDSVSKRLSYSENQRPIVAQLWTTNPDKMLEATRLVVEMGFDGVDINMGCPQRAVTKIGAGAALVKTPNLAKDLIQAAKQGAGEVPVSVKTRTGYNKVITEEWVGFLLQQDLAALSVHARTRKQMSKVPAQWDEIAKTVKLRNEVAPDTVIIGNGDVTDYDNAMQKHDEFGPEGIMIGRGLFTNPWAFSPEHRYSDKSIDDKVKLLKRHLALYRETWGNTKNFAIMKKFFKIYVRDFSGAADFRAKLMECSDFGQVYEVLNEFNPSHYQQ